MEAARVVNAPWIGTAAYEVVQGDWLSSPSTTPVDLVISSMVVEHLADELERTYFTRARDALVVGGRAVVIVPGSPEDWGIEDDIAGHVRRYTRERLRAAGEGAGLALTRMAGLTYPLSNWMLGLSNRLVWRAEKSKRELSIAERTELSGNRHVTLKKSFPRPAAVILNPVVLRPFHWLQKRNAAPPRALVLYGEFQRI